MKAAIEYNNQPAEHNVRVNEVFQDGFPIPTGSLVSVCAWCSTSTLTCWLVKAGYQVSHGVCRECSTNFLNKKN